MAISTTPLAEQSPARCSVEVDSLESAAGEVEGENEGDDGSTRLLRAERASLEVDGWIYCISTTPSEQIDKNELAPEQGTDSWSRKGHKRRGGV
jgi:hypothetical protein